MKLSIVIPTYNVEEYLEKCIESVLFPELGDYEIIIVNDGSTDNSLQIAMSYMSEYPGLIKVISQENGGLGAARNTGIEAAAGEYLLFLDSDDYLSEKALPEIMEVIKTDNDIIIFDFIQVNSAGKNVGNILGCDKTGELSLASYSELLFQPPAACNKIIRAALFTKTGIRFPGRVWFEDLRTIPKLYFHTNKILALRKAWYMYLIRPGSITNSRNLVRNTEIIDAVDDILNYYNAHGQTERYFNELEYLSFYNQFLTSCTRVNLAKWNSPVQTQLIEDFTAKHPRYKDNPYISSMPLKYRLLTFLLNHKLWLSVHALMKTNNKIKNKT